MNYRNQIYSIIYRILYSSVKHLYCSFLFFLLNLLECVSQRDITYITHIPYNMVFVDDRVTLPLPILKFSINF